MRLGVNLAVETAVETARAAERLGYDLALAPEGFRSDAISLLGLVAGATDRIHLTTSVLQVPARTPAMTALTAATLDRLSGGRFRLGLGVSNADVSEGWYGVEFADPVGRLREYVDVVRLALSGEPVDYHGKHLELPLPNSSGERMRLVTPPARPVPIYLASVGPASLRLAGEVADGWLGVFCSPARVQACVERISAGRSRAGLGLDGFEVVASVPIVVGEDPEACAEPLRGHVAHFFAMGKPERNTYLRLAAELGVGEQALAVHALARSGDLAGAAAAVPFSFLDEVALLGPAARIADRVRAYADAGVSVLAVSPVPRRAARMAALEAAVEALETAGVAG